MSNSRDSNQKSQICTHFRSINPKVLPKASSTKKLCICRPTSAAGIISLLHDEHFQLHEFAIRRLNDMADDFWFEIAESISLIESCSKMENFGERKLASLLASKLHYHLASYDKALKYALGAGELLFTSTNKQYISTITNKCLEHYKNARKAECKTIDPRVELIVDKAFHRGLQEGGYRNAVGFCLETGRLDMLRKVILNCEDPSHILKHTFEITISLFHNPSFQRSILECLVEVYGILRNHDYVNFCKCMLLLEDYRGIAETLGILIKGNEDNTLLAYQIAFDLYENATLKLLWKIKCQLKTIAREISHMETIFHWRMREISSILCGDITNKLYLHFLIRYSQADSSILENIKQNCQDQLCHTAIVIANSFMNYGTTSDRFIKDNIEWWCREKSWAEFNAIATLGVINKGCENNSIKTLSGYYLGESRPESVYREGGCLYGLGLIHANRGRMITDYLYDQLKSAKSLEVIHGGCLGIGLATLGTNRKDIYNLLRIRLYQDEATIGESVGIAMGLVFIGSNSESVLTEMITYAHDTKHDKIIRGLAIGIALIMFGQMEKCENLVKCLLNEDHFLRCAAVHTLAMAYSGTGNNNAAQRLLSIAVNDANDDVRRAAIQAIGFLFCQDCDKGISAVTLLSESYNSQSRYSAALALGISCVGTGNNDALSLLWDLTDDMDDLVSQGALIASSLILIQQTPTTCHKLRMFEDLFQEIAEDDLEVEIVKFGAILAQGIIKSGGGNVTSSLKSRGGHINMCAVAGMLVFTQYWYWFPLIHFLSLTFLPTCLIGINSRMNMPQMEFVSDLRPSTSDYLRPMKRRKKLEKIESVSSELSFAKRANKKGTHEDASKEENVEIQKEKRSDPSREFRTSSTRIKSSATNESSLKIILNPARITMQQIKHIKIPEGSRYQPVKNTSEGGIVVMRDKEKGKLEELVVSVMIDTGNENGDDASQHHSYEEIYEDETIICARNTSSSTKT